MRKMSEREEVKAAEEKAEEELKEAAECCDEDECDCEKHAHKRRHDADDDDDHDHRHHGCEHCHGDDDEEEEEGNPVPALIIGLVLGIAAFILTRTGLRAYIIPESLSSVWQRVIEIAIWLVPYLVSSFAVLKEAGEKIIHGNVFNEEVLMTIATVGAIVIGEYPEAVAVMLFYRLGELFEDRAVDKSRDSIVSLMDIRPDSATVLRDGVETKVHPEEVEKGEIIIVRPGEKIPLDGEIIEGSASINTAALTGESKLSDKTAGDSVISGSLSTSGLLKVKTTSEFGESTVSKILKLVENSAEKKAKTEKFISKFAKYYTPIVVGCAVLLAVIPSIITGDWRTWVYRALTFLVVSCPCALVVSVPLTFYAGIGCASKQGILIKGSNYLEILSKADSVVFDKTGTLTKGNFSVEDIHPNQVTADELLDITAAAESYSSHPVAESIVAAHKGHIDKSRIGNVREIAGKGIEAEVDGKIYYVGNGSLMEKVGADWHECHLVGTIVHVSCGKEYLGHIVINDQIKEDSAEAISGLRGLGVNKIRMLTGDDAKVAQNVANKIKIDEYKANLLPEDKITNVEEYMKDSEYLLFVGDGINDAPVLMRADAGIAMGALGSDAAIEAADVVVMDDKPSKIPEAVSISRRTMKIAIQNIIFALAVKTVILILCTFGIVGMWVAVFGDVGVLVLCILNALRAMKNKKSSKKIIK